MKFRTWIETRHKFRCILFHVYHALIYVYIKIMCGVCFSLNKNHFFYLNKFLQAVHWPKHNNFFDFAFGMANRPNINPQSCLSTKTYFIFCSIEHTKTHVCTPHNWCIFLFSMCCTNQFITRFFINFAVQFSNSGTLNEILYPKIRFTQLMPLIWFHSTR